jgi:toxin ParE1/3/4
VTVARVSFAESTLGDLTGIQEWYAEEGVAEVGNRLVAEIFERVEVLADHPNIGRVVPEFGQALSTRAYPSSFRIVYRLDPQRVRVVRV